MKQKQLSFHLQTYNFPQMQGCNFILIYIEILSDPIFKSEYSSILLNQYYPGLIYAESYMATNFVKTAPISL